jgi:hypothetical protein
MGWIERFSNSCSPFKAEKGGFFLRKKPLGILLSGYSDWRTALMRQMRSRRKYQAECAGGIWISFQPQFPLPFLRYQEWQAK